MLNSEKNSRVNLPRLTSIQPRCIPKGLISTIPNHDGGGGVEEFHVHFIARISGALPNYSGVLQFKPWSPQAEGQTKVVCVKNPKTTELIWAVNYVPIHLALATGDGIFSRP
jgi:hypothetical protein